jgi:hypothetical protein
MKIPSRIIQAEPTEVLRGNRAYLRKIDALPVIAKISPADYALIQEGDNANVAISMIQQFNGMDFFTMMQEAIKNGAPLATQKRCIQHLINVNSALKGKGVLYDAQGNLIEGERLINYAQGLYHNRWAYLNGRFPQNAKGEGHKGLDLVIVNANGTEKREPLLTCLEESCYAELASMNEQGQLTRKDSVQKYKPGENLYFVAPVLRTNKPQEGCVARLYAISDIAICFGHPGSADASLGGIVCAEGASPKNSGESK